MTEGLTHNGKRRCIALRRLLAQPELLNVSSSLINIETFDYRLQRVHTGDLKGLMGLVHEVPGATCQVLYNAE